MIKITKRNFDIITFCMKNKSYSKTADHFNLSNARVAQIHNRMALILRRNDPYMKILLSEYTFIKPYKKHSQAIEECFFRIVNQNEFLNESENYE